MVELYLIVRVAGSQAAIAAPDVGSVVEIEEVTPVPRVARHVTGLFALRSRVLTVIDARVSLGLPMVDRPAPWPAVIVTVGGHTYALVVDEVEDVIEGSAPETCPAVLSGGWASASIGVVRHEDRLLPLLDPAVLTAGADRSEAA